MKLDFIWDLNYKELEKMDKLINQTLVCSECNKELDITKATVQNIIMAGVQLSLIPSTDSDVGVAEQRVSIECGCGNINRFNRKQTLTSEMIKPTSNKEYSEKMKQFLRDRNKI